jgi:hypothetical protein
MTAIVTAEDKFEQIAGFQPAEMIWDTDLQLHEQRFRLEIAE